MYDVQDARSFEERRAEVIEIVSSAADFAGADRGLQSIFRIMCASDESEFDAALDVMTASLAESTTRYLQSV
jgi:hypothetical protein